MIVECFGNPMFGCFRLEALFFTKYKVCLVILLG
jgi:hypothetical protein